MKHKGIAILALCLAASVSVGAIEERFTLLPAIDRPSEARSGGPRLVGDWLADGAITRKGFKGRPEYVLADGEYGTDTQVDLLLHMDSKGEVDSSGNWSIAAGSAYTINTALSLLGGGSGSFRGPDSALSLTPGPSSIFGKAGNTGFRDFSVEFWLYPANADNGEVVLLWQSLRKTASGLSAQKISCAVAGGRLLWSFEGFFVAPPGYKGPAPSPVELRGRSPLVPRVWSHQLLRFDGDTGLVEYLVDGESEAVAYATSTGREGGTIFEPAAGSSSPLRFCPEYSGLADELRISRRFVEEPALRPYGRDPALVVTPIADLGYGHSRLIEVDAEYKAPSTTGIEFAYRIADSWAGWRADAPTWTPFRAGEALPAEARGRYVQVKAELYADGTGKLSPELSSVTLRYEADPPPPAPAKLIAYPKDGAVELRWTRVPEADLAGYLIYYGERPGEYFGEGADQGPSPIDAGDTTTITLTGLANGRLLYFAVAAYDAAPDPDQGMAGAPSYRSTRDVAASRAGEFSPEAAARPSRTAR